MEPKVQQQKPLEDGNTLSVIEYQLDADGAEVLKRPVDSYERVLLTTDTPPGGIAGTNPSDSWYLSRKQFLSLYDAIQNGSDFEKVNRFLRTEINEKGDDAKLEDFLAGF